MSQTPRDASDPRLANLDGFRVEIDAGAERADLVLDRPPLNVVTMRQRNQLAAAFEALEAEPAVRVIVVMGAGAHFSSGGHIAGFLEASPERLSRLAWNVAAPERCAKPVVAAVHGYCFGVGFELALACDFRIATEGAEFALPEIRLGMIPGSGGSARLERMIGIGRTKDLAMRARRLSAREALAWGIVGECVPEPDLGAAVSRLVDELRAFSPLAQRTLKAVLNAGQALPLSGAIELEGQAYGRLRGSHDFREGVTAFHEKRKPTFRGE